MILASKGYTDFKTNDLNEWHKALREDYLYCQKLTDFSHLPCKPIDLPSWHPYWKNEVKKDAFRRLQEWKAKYKACKENRNLIKYHFNNTTGLADIEKGIKELEIKAEGVVL
jgi:hypothetical protein